MSRVHDYKHELNEFEIRRIDVPLSFSISVNVQKSARQFCNPVWLPSGRLFFFSFLSHLRRRFRVPKEPKSYQMTFTKIARRALALSCRDRDRDRDRWFQPSLDGRKTGEQKKIKRRTVVTDLFFVRQRNKKHFCMIVFLLYLVSLLSLCIFCFSLFCFFRFNCFNLYNLLGRAARVNRKV